MMYAQGFLLTLGIAALLASEAVGQGRSEPHPCPDRVGPALETLPPEAERRFNEPSGVPRSYYRRILQLELEDTLSPVGICRVLYRLDALALGALRPADHNILVVALVEPPESLRELETRRALAAQSAGVRRAELLAVAQGIRPLR